MKSHVSRLLIASSFLLPLGAIPSQAIGQSAAATAPADPAMWVVRDKDTTIYLFGTFHLMDARRDWLTEEVKNAFDGSKELVLEADIPPDPKKAALRLQPLIARYAVDPQGRTISSQVTPEQNRVLNGALSTIGIVEGSFDRMEPWFINMMLTKAMGQRMGAGIENGADTVLRLSAGKRMTLHTLESAEDQFRMMDGMPEQGSLAQMKVMLDNWDAIGAQLPRMLNVWRRGDTDGLDRIMNAGLRGDPAVRRALLEDRNRAWAAWIKRRLERPGTAFVAVGAAHLVGVDSVQTYLRESGVESTRVRKGETVRTYPACRSKSDDKCVQQS